METIIPEKLNTEGIILVLQIKILVYQILILKLSTII